MSWNGILLLAYLTTGLAAGYDWPASGVIVGFWWLVIFVGRILDDDPP